MARQDRSGRAGRAPSQRALRVGEAIRHALAELMLRGGFRDPELAGASITVTEVRMSPDLRNATAFVMPLGGGDGAATVAALNRAAGYVRGEVGRAVRLRFAPDIAFRLDASFDAAARIDRLIAEVGGEPEETE
ncbi:MAG: 30S ribosome-binding factor RbfA [Alphaproteobacteria bacterium]